MKLARLVVPTSFLLASLAVGCTDGDTPMTPSARTADMAVRPIFPTLSAAGARAMEEVSINRIRLTVHDGETGDVLGQVVSDVDAEADSWELAISVDIEHSSQVVVFVEMIHVVDGLETVVWSGEAGPYPVNRFTDYVIQEIALVLGPIDNLAVTGLEIEDPDVLPVEGDAVPLEVALELDDPEANPVVYWTSLDEEVASVSEAGHVETRLPGVARIVAEAGVAADTIELAVGPRPVEIELEPELLELASIGEEGGFSARVRDARGDLIEDVSLEWSTGSGDVVEPLGEGRFRALLNGTSPVTVSWSGDPQVSGGGTVVVEQHVAEVEIAPGEATLDALGATQVFTAVARDAGGAEVAGAGYAWSSSDQAVAAVGAGGAPAATEGSTNRITAVATGDGTTVITATAGGVSGSATLTVERVVAGVEVTPAAAELDALDATQAFAAVARDPGGAAIDGAAFTWASSDESVATVDASGTATATGEGTTDITATAGGVSGSATLTVTLPVEEEEEDPVVASVEVTPSSASLDALGATQAFSAVARDGDGTAIDGVAFTWASSDEGVATVDASGTATATGEGTTQITATADGVSGSATLQVQQLVETVEITPTAASFSTLGETLTFSYAAYDAGGAVVPSTDPVWITTDPDVASVDASGTATATGNGSGHVIVAVDGVVDTADVTVRQAVAGVVVTRQPENTPVGETIPTVEAEVRDAGGSRITDYEGVVTISVASGPAEATLGGTTSRAASAGRVAFDDLTLDVTGTYQLEISVSGAPPAATTAFDLFSTAVTSDIRDVALQQTVDPAIVAEGGEVTFMVTATNAGSVDLTGVEVEDVVPEGLTLVSTTATQGAYDAATGLWSVGSLSSGTAATLTMVASADVGTTGTTVVTTARLHAVSPGDDVPGNDEASAQVWIGGVDLALSKVADPAVVSFGRDDLSFVVKVRNLGPFDATGVVVLDELPSSVRFRSAEADVGTYDESTGLWTIPALAAGDTATLRLRTQVVTPNNVTNTAQILELDQIDPNPDNDTASATAVRERGNSGN